ncbi:MAG: hypothetical protein ACFFG0_02490 [Candidatus Thorarchaeota archaeon]
MYDKKDIKKLKAYAETSITFLSNALWLEPEKIGLLLAECTAETCKNIYGTENGSVKRLRADWLKRIEEGFTNRLGELIMQGKQ